MARLSANRSALRSASLQSPPKESIHLHQSQVLKIQGEKKKSGGCATATIEMDQLVGVAHPLLFICPLSFEYSTGKKCTLSFCGEWKRNQWGQPCITALHKNRDRLSYHSCPLPYTVSWVHLLHHKFSHCCSVLITFTWTLACEASLPKRIWSVEIKAG